MKDQMSPVRAYCIILMILIVSIWSLFSIELGDDSKSASESFTIIFKHFGRDPENIEKTITIPLEIKLRNVRGIESISCRSELGNAKIYLFMKPGFNFESAYIDIRDAIYGLYSGLPSSVQKPLIYSGNNLEEPQIIFTINSEFYNSEELQYIAEKDIKPALENIKEAGEIQIGGGALTEILLCIDRARATSLGISPQDISKLIGESYLHNSINNIESAGSYYSILYEGRFNSPQELLEVIVTTSDGKQFPLSAIANIKRQSKEPETISRLNGDKKLIFYVKSSGRGSIITLSDKLNKVLSSKGNSGIDYEMVLDNGAILKKAISSLVKSIVISVIVVSFFIILGLGKPIIAIPTALSLPYNALISLAIFNAAGLTIGLSSLLGIGLAIGAVADSGIIITSFIINESKGRKFLSKEIKISLVSSALTTVIVTMPILLSSQIALDAKRIALSFFIFIIVSTITNMILLPIVISSMKVKSIQKRKWRFNRKLNLFILKALKIPPKMIFLFSGLLLIFFIIGMIFTPRKIDSDISSNNLSVHLEMKGGTSLNHVDANLHKLTDKLQNIRGVTEVESFARRENGTISVKYNSNIISEKELSSIIDSFNDLLKEASVIVLKGNSKDELSVSIRIQGADIKILKEKIEAISERFKEEAWIKNIIYHFKEGGPVLSYKTSLKARAQNFTPQMINQYVHWALQGPVSLKWLDQSDEYDLRIVNNSDEVYKSPEDIKKIIVNNGKTNGPLSDLAIFSLSNNNTAIFRNNLQRSLEFSVITDSGNINNTFRNIENILKDISLPPGYRYHVDDSIMKKRHEFKILIFFILAAIILVYIVLSAVFESFLLPLLIIFNIPISLAPSFIIINLFGIPFSSRVFVGFIIVTGIIVNNSILITEKTMSLGIDNSIFKNIFFSVKKRLSSILMTTASTCVGLLPIILGNGQGLSIRFLALVIFFGVLSSFFFGIFLYPAILLNITKRQLLKKEKAYKIISKGVFHEK